MPIWIPSGLILGHIGPSQPKQNLDGSQMICYLGNIYGSNVVNNTDGIMIQLPHYDRNMVRSLKVYTPESLAPVHIIWQNWAQISRGSCVPSTHQKQLKMSFTSRKNGDEWSVEPEVMNEIEAFTCLKYGQAP